MSKFKPMSRAVRATVNAAFERVRMSWTSKLGTYSWSLQARETCPGSLGDDGELVDACKGCYASFGNYIYENVKAPRRHNKEDWERAEWEDDMVSICSPLYYVRLFDSGDMYALALARKWLNVFRRCPDTQFWLPTRMHKFPKFAAILNAMNTLPNVCVRPSSDSVLGEFDPAVHGSVIFPAGSTPPEGVFECGAYTRDGQCGPCRACYDKDIPVIGYPSHGRVMSALVRRRLASIAVVTA